VCLFMRLMNDIWTYLYIKEVDERYMNMFIHCGDGWVICEYDCLWKRQVNLFRRLMSNIWQGTGLSCDDAVKEEDAKNIAK
jgi:hypothetical protein